MHKILSVEYELASQIILDLLHRDLFPRLNSRPLIRKTSKPLLNRIDLLSPNTELSSLHLDSLPGVVMLFY